MDPYKVLGVDRNADEETIKKAYRKLVKKYHPDRYVNTPMADMASEKMKEINEAYDILTNKNTQNTGYNGYNTGGYYGGYSQSYDYSNVSFDTVRRLITSRRIIEAEAMLQRLPHNAEWHYLMGIIYMNKGWYSQGMEYINKAIQLDPTNPEYQSATQGFGTNARNYRDVVFTSSSPMCSVCPSLCLSWLMCNFCNFCRCC